jgi:hypothetical protein
MSIRRYLRQLASSHLPFGFSDVKLRYFPEISRDNILFKTMMEGEDDSPRVDFGYV